MAVVDTYAIPGGASAVRAGLGGVWIVYSDRDAVLHLDPATGTIEAAIATGAGPLFFDVGEGGVWVMNQADGSVSHIDPATDSVVATIVVECGNESPTGLPVATSQSRTCLSAPPVATCFSSLLMSGFRVKEPMLSSANFLSLASSGPKNSTWSPQPSSSKLTSIRRDNRTRVRARFLMFNFVQVWYGGVVERCVC
jgi:YVTN family beta-propeller protein